MNRRSARAAAIVAIVVGLATVAACAAVPPERAALAAATPALNTFQLVSANGQWLAGTRDKSVAVVGGSLSLGPGAGHTRIGGTAYDAGNWTSTWIQPKHAFTQVIPSWDALTPNGTLVQISLRVRSSTGALSTWQNMGRWASSDAAYQRTSLGPQTDSLSSVATDTLVARSGIAFSSYQLRVGLLRRTGTTLSPTVRSVHAVASQLASSLAPTSARLLPAKTLTVPAYSQMTHAGEYPQYGGGGEAWCSPTSLSMVLAYFKALPPASSYTWVSSRYSDRQVDATARNVFDHGYDGTGNWPFNTAFASTLVAASRVTRLASLRDAEKFIANGIPLEASISFSRGQLSGAPISATAGHLVVIIGFTSNGNVVVNDPAAPRNSTVRRVYDRGQFERAWQRKSHGLVYAIRDGAHRFPAGYGLG